MTDELDQTPADEPAAYAEPDTGEMPVEDVEAMNQTLPMILSFLVLPLVFVIVGTGVLMAFGMATYESADPQRYVEMLQSGSANRRWQAAFELAKLIAQDPGSMREANLGRPLVAVFEDTAGETEEERMIRRYLASCMGSLGDPAAIPTLRAALADPDGETRIYVIAALGRLGATAAVPDLVGILQEDDPGVVKAAAFALGAIASAESADALVPMLKHGVADVRWNAAQSLAKMGDGRAAPVLWEMIDREAVAGVNGIVPRQVEATLTAGIRCAAALRLAGVEEHLTLLAEQDPNLRVRDAAFQALETLRPRPEALASSAQAAA